MHPRWFVALVLTAAACSTPRNDPPTVDAPADVEAAGGAPGADARPPIAPDVAMGNDLRPELDAQPVRTTEVAPPPDLAPATVRLTVKLAGEGRGRVVSEPAGLDCPGTCALDVAAGAMVKLRASATTGSGFQAWSMGCTARGASECALKVAADLELTASFAGAGGLMWARPTGEVKALAVTSTDEILTTGMCYGSVDFGVPPVGSQHNDRDAFIAKYGPRGEPIWARRMGAAEDQMGLSVAGDRQGNVYGLVASLGDAVLDLGGGGTRAGGERWNLHPVKLDRLGAHLWSFAVLAGAGRAEGTVTVDAADRPMFDLGLDLNTEIDAARSVRAGPGHFMVNYLADGARVSQRLITTGQIFGLVFDDAGNAFASGQTGGGTTVGGRPVPFGPEKFGSYVAKLDPSGAAIWVRGFAPVEATGRVQAAAVAVAPGGEVVATGSFTGNVDFGGGVLRSVGNGDGFVVKLSASGAHLWSQRFGATSEPAAERTNDFGLAIAIDAGGNSYVGASVAGGASFGAAGVASGDPAFGRGVLFKLDPAGQPQWIFPRKDDSHIAWFSAVDATGGRVLLGGPIYGEVDLGLGPQLFDNGLVAEIVP